MSQGSAEQVSTNFQPAAVRGRNLAVTGRALGSWLSARAGAPVVVSDLEYPVGAGRSNETILFKAHWTNGTRQPVDLVLRAHPGSMQLFLDPQFEMQYELLGALQERTEVIVPRIRWFEPDPAVIGNPFFIMDRLYGRVPVINPSYNVSGWLADAEPTSRRKVWVSAMEQIIEIHTAPIAAFEFLDNPSLGANGFDQLWNYTDRFYQWASEREPVEFLESAHAWLSEHLPAEKGTGLTWGDARLGNMMFDEKFDVVGVLDWEQACLAGGLQDLGWWLFFDDVVSICIGVPRLEGLGTRKETVEIWEDGTGTSARDLHWYEVFAGYRASIIVLRLLKVQGGAAPGFNRSNNIFTRHLAELLEITPPADASEVC